MAKLIAVVGNTGIGKTTLTRILSEKLGLITGLEEHNSRPFQLAFKNDPSYALANQVDYLLLRAEQETHIRLGNQNGIIDGGMEMDFQVFSRLFLSKNMLTGAEFSLLERLYTDFRMFLPPPEVIVFMQAPVDMVSKRFQSRGRTLEIATLADLHKTEELLQNWINSLDHERVIRLNVCQDDPTYQEIIVPLCIKIQQTIQR